MFCSFYLNQAPNCYLYDKFLVQLLQSEFKLVLTLAYRLQGRSKVTFAATHSPYYMLSIIHAVRMLQLTTATKGNT